MKIVLLGKPIPAKRPRVLRTHTYNPLAEQARRDHYKAIEQVKAEWKRLYPWLDSYTPLATGFELRFSFFMPIPPSWSNKEKNLHYGTHHIFRPDVDNLLKYYMDILQSALYKDDKQVHTVFAEKRYINNEDEAPRTEIEVM